MPLATRQIVFCCEKFLSHRGAVGPSAAAVGKKNCNRRERTMYKKLKCYFCVPVLVVEIKSDCGVCSLV